MDGFGYHVFLFVREIMIWLFSNMLFEALRPAHKEKTR